MAKPKRVASPRERFDVYQHVTNQIIAALEKGVRPWVKPWSGDHLACRVRRPLRACGKAYCGINVLVLWLTATAQGYRSPFWLTFKQALELGGNVRKGEHGAKVCYFDKLTREKLDQETGETTEHRIPFIKTYTVFAAEQCEGLPEHFLPPPEIAPTPAEIEARLAHVETFIAHTGAEIRHGGDRACYSVVADRISMPPFPSFATPEDYYSTILHELVHLTKHPSRLDRECGSRKWGDEGYAREELVAEVGSALLCADLAIALTPRADHASYIASWLKVLQNDKRAIFQAAAMAERAASWLHDQQPPPSATNDEEILDESQDSADAPLAPVLATAA